MADLLSPLNHIAIKERHSVLFIEKGQLDGAFAASAHIFLSVVWPV